MNYDSLKVPGVIGEVVSQNYSRESIYNTSKFSAALLLGQPAPGIHDFGLEVYVDGHMICRKLPGQGSGWFRSEDDAAVYGLAQIRKLVPQEFASLYDIIDWKISSRLNKSLF